MSSAPQQVDQAVTWLLNNREKYFHFLRYVQLAVGIFLILFGYAIGKDHLQLVMHGQRATGTIVGYKQVSIRRSSGFYDTANMPVVEFNAEYNAEYSAGHSASGSNSEPVRFQDWLSRPSDPYLHSAVPVLYDPANPAIAMIDRPLWNWIPWAPTIAVGLLLVLSGAKGLLFPAKTTT
jgi:hypothetical protein